MIKKGSRHHKSARTVMQLSKKCFFRVVISVRAECEWKIPSANQNWSLIRLLKLTVGPCGNYQRQQNNQSNVNLPKLRTFPRRTVLAIRASQKAYSVREPELFDSFMCHLWLPSTKKTKWYRSFVKGGHQHGSLRRRHVRRRKSEQVDSGTRDLTSF